LERDSASLNDILVAKCDHLVLNARVMVDSLVGSAMAYDPLFGGIEAPYFTIGVLPDTQQYTANHPEIFEAQTQWLAEKRRTENVRCVVHVGDIVESPTDEQWERAKAAFQSLEKYDIPLLLAPGNHDYDDIPARQLESFERTFPLGAPDAPEWHGGSYEGERYNSYVTFSEAGGKYILLSLELFPRGEIIRWADEVLQRHPQHNAILTTHAYLHGDALIGTEDSWDRTDFGLSGHNGDELWEQLLKHHSNVKAVLCGHIADEALVTKTGECGNKVHQLVNNFEDRRRGGDGYLRLFRVYPRNRIATVETYSPVLERHLLDGHNYRIQNF
jgi:predicted phosphodiesterase